ncbi:hypothetical protein ACIBCN_42280 [Nocardia sp. NPDC051052]|uniref:hypothetical protein n=1 Tax=Nocardia sp. NPDC051052 TaxID=3364322 RepID=UPI0037B7A803
MCTLRSDVAPHRPAHGAAAVGKEFGTHVRQPYPDSAVRRSPQEKKQLSYAKDRRNSYGENDKASRKNLPRSRARAHRANRHRAHQDLQGAAGLLDVEVSDAADVRLRGRRPKAFVKHPDVPLAVHLRWRLDRRQAVDRPI